MPGVEEAAGQLVKAGGIIGAMFILVTIPLAIYAWRIGKKLTETQEKRTADAQAVSEQLLKFNGEWQKLLSDQVIALRDLHKAVSDTCTVVREIRDYYLVQRAGNPGGTPGGAR